MSKSTKNHNLTTTSDKSALCFHSLHDGDYGGSMTSLLKWGGYLELPSSRLNEANILVFNGGADIGTEIYDENPISGVPNKMSKRDYGEIAVFNAFKDPRILKVGICRGAQLLNCLNGGTLWQDVNNHQSDHAIIIRRSGTSIPATSTHHQMMRPNYKTAEIIATADRSTRKRTDLLEWKAGGPVFFEDDHKDAEIVYYADTNSLCIQGHPEYVPGSMFADFCMMLINQYSEVPSCVA